MVDLFGFADEQKHLNKPRRVQAVRPLLEFRLTCIERPPPSLLAAVRPPKRTRLAPPLPLGAIISEAIMQCKSWPIKCFRA
jgi:hypothetical protein